MAKFKENFNETKKNLKMSWQFIKNQKKTLVLIIILSLCFSVISVIIPVLSAQLLLNLSEGLLEQLIQVAIIIFAVEMIRNILSFFFRRVMESYMILGPIKNYWIDAINIKNYLNMKKWKTIRIGKELLILFFIYFTR